MIGRLASAVLHHRAIVLALTAVFLLAGANAFRELPVEATRMSPMFPSRSSRCFLDTRPRRWSGW